MSPKDRDFLTRLFLADRASLLAGHLLTSGFPAMAREVADIGGDLLTGRSDDAGEAEDEAEGPEADVAAIPLRDQLANAVATSRQSIWIDGGTFAIQVTGEDAARLLAALDADAMGSPTIDPAVLDRLRSRLAGLDAACAKAIGIDLANCTVGVKARDVQAILAAFGGEGDQAESTVTRPGVNGSAVGDDTSSRPSAGRAAGWVGPKSVGEYLLDAGRALRDGASGNELDYAKVAIVVAVESMGGSIEFPA